MGAARLQRVQRARETILPLPPSVYKKGGEEGAVSGFFSPSGAQRALLPMLLAF